MSMEDVKWSSYEIFNISLNIIILIIVLIQLISSHHGDCRGVVLSQVKTPDGNFVTRQAKLSFQIGNHVFSSKKVKILLFMNTAGKLKVIGSLRNDTDGFSNGRKNLLPVPN